MNAIIGAGAVGDLRALLDSMGVHRVFLVTGGASFATSGTRAALARQLDGRVAAHHRCLTPNPTLDDALRALVAFRSRPCDVVVAAGGGTPLDTAKLVVAFSDPGVAPLDVVRRTTPAASGPPLIAIPTTAGTGSEATHFASIYVDGVKHSVAGAGLRPALTLVDPELTYTVPPYITATTGLDALCQAVESHWSVRANAASRAHSRAAMSAIPSALRRAATRPTPAARLAMSRAAFRAGQAIDHTFTTACHALSYHLTSTHGVPHGHAVALTLPPVLRFNAAVTEADALADLDDTRAALDEIIAALGGADAGSAAREVTTLIRDLGLPTRLADVGCATAAQRAALVDAVNVERLGNNPRRVDHVDLARIVDEVG